MTSIEEYIALPYHISLIRDADEDGKTGWVASVEELPGCVSQGDTPDDAVRNVYNAMEGWLSAALEDGQSIPPPRADDEGYSGRVLVRMPRSMHAELIRLARREQVSLNQLVITLLAGSLHWRNTAGTSSRPGTLGQPSPRKRARE